MQRGHTGVSSGPGLPVGWPLQRTKRSPGGPCSRWDGSPRQAPGAGRPAKDAHGWPRRPARGMRLASAHLYTVQRSIQDACPPMQWLRLLGRLLRVCLWAHGASGRRAPGSATQVMLLGSYWIPGSCTPRKRPKHLILNSFFQGCSVSRFPRGKPVKTICYVKLDQL
jgi:hypothetical protein